MVLQLQTGSVTLCNRLPIHHSFTYIHNTAYVRIIEMSKWKQDGRNWVYCCASNFHHINPLFLLSLLNTLCSVQFLQSSFFPTQSWEKKFCPTYVLLYSLLKVTQGKAECYFFTWFSQNPCILISMKSRNLGI